MKQARKTKIVCTIGPVSENKEVMMQLVKAGMNVMRMNFSHGDFVEHGNRMKTIRAINEELNTNVALMLDTKGPEIRTHKFEFGGVTLIKDAKVRISMTEVLGTQEKFSVTHANLINDVEVGGKILVDDGNVTLDIIEIDHANNEIVCVVKNDAYIKDRRGINVPDIDLSLDFISEKDRADIEFGCDSDVDYIAASFVRTKKDILQMREILNRKGKPNIQIIAKIENMQGVKNIDEILSVVDGIMVARGDLGVEVPTYEVPVIQKNLIKKCHIANKPVIVATQMLESMQKNPRPTRAEASDVANAVYASADAIMLSGETAAGKYPVEAVKIMDEIARRIEKELDYNTLLKEVGKRLDLDITTTIGLSAAHATSNLNSSLIVTPTSSGFTPRSISQFRPCVPIIAITNSNKVCRSLALNWGVLPIVYDLGKNSEEVMTNATKVVKEKYNLEAGEIIVLTAGMPLTGATSTNTMKIELIK